MEPTTPTATDVAALQSKLDIVDVDAPLTGEVETIDAMGTSTGTLAMVQVSVYGPGSPSPEPQVIQILALGVAAFVSMTGERRFG